MKYELGSKLNIFFKHYNSKGSIYLELIASNYTRVVLEFMSVNLFTLIRLSMFRTLLLVILLCVDV